MVAKNSHICVCICTYKRPKLLKRLLDKLLDQKTNNLFTYSIVVVDNDHAQSAKKTVTDIKEKSIIPMGYYVEPEQNIALARNRAIQNASGNFVAFIDDDEFPVDNWLLNLHKTYNDYNADGVLGPVKPHFEKEPPKWIIKGKICERKYFDTGTILRNYSDTRTGNVLLAKKLFDDEKNLFDQNFGRTGGEDVDFFKRMIEKESVFIWCNEAPVYETIPPERWTKNYHLKKALLRGKVSSNNTSFKVFDFLKSVIAFATYTLALPFFFIIGQHIFMKYLIKDCDHIGKLMGVFNINIVKEREF